MDRREVRKAEGLKVDRKAAGKAKSASTGAISREVQDRLGRQLRAIYDEIVDEPIPEWFVTLLRELGRKRDGSQ